MNSEEFAQAWSDLHGGVKQSGFVRGWLAISRPLAIALAKLKVSANVLTLLGVIAAIFVWRTAAHPYAIAILAVSLLLDGLDGSLSIVRGTSSSFGAVLDSFADRISEFFWALAFYALGATWWIIGIAWLAAFVQEYVRARLAALDTGAIEFVSICERPVRAAFLAVAALSVALHHDYVQKVAIFWFTFQIVALATVLMETFTRLRTVNSIDDQLGADSDEG
jgi:phosphatidylglycerophosphate synthase